MNWKSRFSILAVLGLLLPSSTLGSGLWSQSLLGGLQEVELVVDPTNRSVLYAGTLWGGVLKSTDWGAQWRNMSEGLTNPRVRTLALDPVDSSTLYAGTEGGGVFRSTDAGASWQAINSGLTHTHVRDLVIDPTNPSTLYAGTPGGVFKSPDSGANWEEINNGLANRSIFALAIDPHQPRHPFRRFGHGGVSEYEQRRELGVDRFWTWWGHPQLDHRPCRPICPVRGQCRRRVQEHQPGICLGKDQQWPDRHESPGPGPGPRLHGLLHTLFRDGGRRGLQKH